MQFLRSIPDFAHVAENTRFYADPAKELQNILKSNPEFQSDDSLAVILPPGRYAVCSEPAYIGRKTKIEKFYALPKQGWKIHVSARSNFQKIAAQVMAVIEQDEAYPHLKIIPTLPRLRTAYYITGRLKGDGLETQVGKFIAIYPANKKHCAVLAESIDRQLMWAIRGKSINRDDFYPLMGDALVGESGGVFVRYGNIGLLRDELFIGDYCEAKFVKPVPPKKKKAISKIETGLIENSFIELTEEKVPDDRYHPWPDFMNKSSESWNKARDPFPGLNMRWISPHKQIITWSNRPDFWSCL